MHILKEFHLGINLSFSNPKGMMLKKESYCIRGFWFRIGLGKKN